MTLEIEVVKYAISPDALAGMMICGVAGFILVVVSAMLGWAGEAEGSNVSVSMALLPLLMALLLIASIF